ncbi:YrdB family protein [Actinopolymorpha pittospori]
MNARPGFTQANLLLVFLLELGALAALGYAASTASAATAARVALGVTVPVVAAALWGLFAAPRARFRLPAARLAVKVLVFGSAGLGLVLSGHATSGITFVAVVLLNALALRLAPPREQSVPTPGVPARGVA